MVTLQQETGSRYHPASILELIRPWIWFAPPWGVWKHGVEAFWELQ